jgi:DNA-binding beta-propeller fold protein YncE
MASDDILFVAGYNNHRVHVLTPWMDFHGFVGVGELGDPGGVCANADVVVVSENEAHSIAVLTRADGALLRRFGSLGTDDGEVDTPTGLCVVSHDRHVAVAERDNDRVSVFSIDGEFIRHVGGGLVKVPHGVACSVFDELVVADPGHSHVPSCCDQYEQRAGEGAWSRRLKMHCDARWHAQDHDNQKNVSY